MLRTTTELFAARRYMTNVLLHLSDADISIDSSISIKRFIELLDYFAEHPTEYLELTNGNQSK